MNRDHSSLLRHITILENMLMVCKEVLFKAEAFDKTFTRSLHANLATAMEDASQNNVALSVASEIALVAHFLRCRFYFPKIKGTPAGSTFPDERVESLWRNLSIKYADIIRSCPIDDEIDICQGTNAKRRRLC